MGASGGMTWNFKRKVGGSFFRATMGAVHILGNGKVDPSNVEEARIWAAEMRKKASEGTNLAQVKREAREAPLMEELWDDFTKSSRFADKAPSSQQGDKRTWSDHILPFFKGVKVEDVDRTMVKSFLDETFQKIRNHRQSKNGARVNDVRALLSTLFTEAISIGYVDINPVTAVKPRKIIQRDKYPLTQEQSSAVLRESYKHSQEMGLIVEIAMTMGLRKSNILKAEWQEIGDGVLTISATKMKGKRQHSVLIPPRLMERLEEWRRRLGVVNSKGDFGTITRNKGFIFPSTSTQYDKGRRDSSKLATPEWDRPHRASIKTAWKTIVERANVEGLRFHDLRHYFGTTMASGGMGLHHLKNLMAHSDGRTTQHYINSASMTSQRELIEAHANKLSEGLKEAQSNATVHPFPSSSNSKG